MNEVTFAPKFKVGQRVWLIRYDSYDKKYKYIGKELIIRVLYETDKDGPQIRYEVEYENGLKETHHECNAFADERSMRRDMARRIIQSEQYLFGGFGKLVYVEQEEEGK